MKSFVARLAITALGLWAADAIVGGFHVEGWQNVVIAALLLGIVNALVRPVIVLLTLHFMLSYRKYHNHTAENTECVFNTTIKYISTQILLKRVLI